MSLDVYLEGELKPVKCTCRECGNEHTNDVAECFYSANITHNLGVMAEAAGIYKHVWRPEELAIYTASELIEPLRAGIAKMKADPEKFKAHNSPNGWGLYENFLPWLERYLEACEMYPGAHVSVSR